MGVDPSNAPRRLPPGRVEGRFRPPGSKSLAIRALLCAGVAQGRTRVAGLSGGDDVEAALELLRAARVGLRELAPAAVEVSGRPPGPERGPTADAPLDARESGTLARMACALLGLCAPAGRPIELRVRGTLRGRSSPALFQALARAGVGLERAAGVPDGGWPVTLRPVGPPPTVTLEHPSSSQEASGLLVALAAWPGESALEVRGAIPSRPYLEMTRGVLGRFGARVEVETWSEGERFTVRGPLTAPPEPFTVEPDASAAAVALAAACLSGGALEVPGLGAGSLQGDARIVRHLAAFGCRASASADALRATGGPRHGAELDLSGEPDLAPVLAAVAAAAASQGHASRLFGLETLEGKESARITVLAAGLRRLGLRVTHDDTQLAFASGAPIAVGGARAAERPLGPTSSALVLDPHDDHRMAFAFALLGILDARVHVASPACVSKSWPTFWDDLRALAE